MVKLNLFLDVLVKLSIIAVNVTQSLCALQELQLHFWFEALAGSAGVA